MEGTLARDAVEAARSIGGGLMTDTSSPIYMTHTPSAIYLGDLARALGELDPSDDATRRSIAVLLGLSWDVPEQPRPHAARSRPEPPPAPTHRVPRPRPRFERAEQRGESLPLRIEHTLDEAVEPSIDVAPMGASAPEEFAPPPPFEPLFFPRWTRAILSTALSTYGVDGQLDVERVAETLARGEHLDRWPTLSWPTLSRGIQLLVDRGRSMAPFIGDQISLQKELVQVVGRDRVQTLRFVGCPLRGAGAGPVTSWSEYRPPPSGTPVLLLSDLGIGRPLVGDDRAGVAEWLGFARLVRKARCPLVAFVPYAAPRWPRSLAPLLTMIHWDRRTTASVVRNRVGRAHEVKA